MAEHGAHADGEDAGLGQWRGPLGAVADGEDLRVRDAAQLRVDADEASIADRQSTQSWPGMRLGASGPQHERGALGSAAVAAAAAAVTLNAGDYSGGARVKRRGGADIDTRCGQHGFDASRCALRHARQKMCSARQQPAVQCAARAQSVQPGPHCQQ